MSPNLSLEMEAVVKTHKDQSSSVLDMVNPILANAKAFWGGYVIIEGQLEGTHYGADLKALHAEYLDLVSRDAIDPNEVQSVTAKASLVMLGKREY